jgi:hypothetical protein
VLNAPNECAQNQHAKPDWPNFVLLATYALAIGTTIHFHAMWRDEMQAWLIARDSADLPALFHNLHYEGHAALWYLLLMPLTRLSHDPVLMQALHFLIATTTVAMVLWRAPFSLFERALFPFGYFTFYEYAVKSRGYVLGCLFVFLFCALWHRRRQSPVAIALVLAMMANVDVLFMILSIAAVFALIVDWLIIGPTDGEKGHAGWPLYLLAVIIVCSGWALAVATALPPSDSGVAGWFFGRSPYRLDRVLEVLSTLLTPQGLNWVSVPTIAILVVAFIRYRENPPAAAFLGTSVLGLLTFFYTRIPPAPWRSGLIVIAFFAAVWIDRISVSRALRRALVPPILFGVVLAFQAYAGVTAVWSDLHQPLSRSRDVARFIVEKGWAQDPVVGALDYTTIPIVSYLKIDRAYYLNARRWGSFGIWDKRRLEPVDMEQALANAARIAPNATLVISPGIDVDPAILRKFGFMEVANFTGAREPFETYTVYRHSAEVAPGPQAH